MKSIKTMGIVFFLGFFQLLWAEFNCGKDASGPYCHWTGTISQVYLYDGLTILLYVNETFNPKMADAVGLSVSSGSALTYSMKENIEFGKLLYATMLSAQARNKTVKIESGVSNGTYLVIRKIWSN